MGNIINYQVVWYFKNSGLCFDEEWYEQDEIDIVKRIIDYKKENNYIDYCRVFVHMDDGSEYEM